MPGPVVVIGSGELCLDLVETGDLGAGCRRIACTGGAKRASEVRDRLGHGKLAVANGQLRRPVPATALQRKARRSGRQRSVDPQLRDEKWFKVGKRIDDLLRVAVSRRLQVGVHKEIREMGHDRMGPIRIILRRNVICRGFRREIGADRILPHAEHRIDVRRHMQRVR